MIELQPHLKAVLDGIPPFSERVWFDSEMDQLVFLREDVSFRADRVDEYLTLLWHPYEERLVGLKLKGIQSKFDVVVKASGHGNHTDMPLVDLIFGVMVGSAFASKRMDRLGDGRREAWFEKYELARQAADDQVVPTDLKKIRLAA